MMDTDKELSFEREKRVCGKISLSLFIAALFLVVLALVFGGTIGKVLLVSAAMLGAIGLKVFSVWYLLYGGVLDLLEKLGDK